MAENFAHLHTHSSHSVRDSIARPDDLFAAAKADHQPALAVTDHGNLSGLYVAYEAAKRHGVALIAGVEAYMAVEDGEPDARLRRLTITKPRDDDGGYVPVDGEVGVSKYTHMTLLAENADGLSNLMRLGAIGNDADAFWSKPRIDLTVLAEHSKGLIGMSGCLGGIIKNRLAAGDVDGAYSAARDLVEIFGKDNFFVEVMSHGITAEDKLNDELKHIAKRHGLRIVATNDSHFTHKDDVVAHEAWLCGASSKTLTDPTRWRFVGEGYHLRSASEMRAIFDDVPGFEQACDNTLLIAERATGYEMFPKHRLRIPTFDPENEKTADELLHERVREGALRLYGNPLPLEVQQRLRYETDIISGAGLADYFLIVSDMIDWAKAQGIRVGPGRGSAAGSCVSYCMGIIAVEPLKYGLLFERFLNPTRNKMPDIDTDFEQGRRHEVVAYLVERWGRDSVSMIGTLGYSLSKNSLNVAGKVTDQPGLGAKLSDQVPTLGSGKTASIASLTNPTFAPGAAFRDTSAQDGADRIIEIAERFEGVVNTESIHPCGVVIGDERLLGLIPLRGDRRATDKGGAGGWVSEFDGGALEDLGYLKMDVLGVLTLDVIEATVREIERRHGVRLDTNAIPDEGTPEANRAWSLISEGRTEGLFQIEGGGVRKLAMRLRPTSVADLAVIIALYRPGPLGIGMDDMYANRVAGIEPANYDIFTHDVKEAAVLASVMDETMAVMVYQEQLLRIGELVGGFDSNERDNLLRAIGKKIRAQMDRSGDLFIQLAQTDTDMVGQPKLAFSLSTAEHLWEAMKSAGEYSFNKSHSVGYARLSFETAWLKANYPAEFTAGWLAKAENQDKRLAFLGALGEEGVTLLHPNVNISLNDPTVGEDGSVLLGLAKIRDVGSNGQAIVSERETRGPFRSLLDLASRVKVSEKATRISTTALKALIESGACDTFGPRKGLFDAVDALRKSPNALVSNEEWGFLEKTARERQRLGVLVSESPLTVFKDQIKTWRSPNAPSQAPIPVHHLPEGGVVQTIGVVTNFEVVKRKTRFAKMTLTGTKGLVDCILWNSTLERVERTGVVPAKGDIIGVDATVQRRQIPSNDQNEEDGAEAASVKELIINAIWSQPIVDDSATTATSFSSLSDQQSIFDQEPTCESGASIVAGEATSLEIGPEVIKKVISSPSYIEDDGYVDEFVSPDVYGDDGFDYLPVNTNRIVAQTVASAPEVIECTPSTIASKNRVGRGRFMDYRPTGHQTPTD